MGLIACKDCGAQISRTALRCPKCGGWQTVALPRWVDVPVGLIFIGGTALAYFQAATWADRLTILFVASLPAMLAYGFAFAGRR